MQGGVEESFRYHFCRRDNCLVRGGRGGGRGCHLVLEPFETDDGSGEANDPSRHEILMLVYVNGWSRRAD